MGANGFRGALNEFLRSIEEHREPGISATNNLHSLELCFAALASADTGVTPGARAAGPQGEMWASRPRSH